MTGIVITSNQLTQVGLVVLKNAILQEEATEMRPIVCVEDTNSYALFPVNSLFEDIELNIFKRNATTAQIAASTINGTISPKPAASFKVFNFELEVGRKPVHEVEIDEPISIVLHYDDTELPALGGDESSLAIYYYKENTGEWVKLGGKQDLNNNTLTITVNYLHDNYAIFSTTLPTFVKGYGDLKCWPNPFTPNTPGYPSRGGRTYENLKISFLFENPPVTAFKFVVYDTMGREIYSKEYQGSYYQGEIFWNGRDNGGRPAKSDIYIFQIETGEEYNRGIVMILR